LHAPLIPMCELRITLKTFKFFIVHYIENFTLIPCDKPLGAHQIFRALLEMFFRFGMIVKLL
jgi:hypothetical protein